MTHRRFLAALVALALLALLTGCSPSTAPAGDAVDAPEQDAATPPVVTVTPVEPEETTEPEETAEPEVTTEPEPMPVEPEPVTPDPAPEATPEPTPEPTPDPTPEPTEPDISEEEPTEMKMMVTVNGQTFTATLAQNGAVDALVQLLAEGAVTLQLSDYAGFEKVGPLGQSLPASDSQTTTQAGDIVLYQGNQIVMFYGTNSWSYTRLGRIDDLTGWAEALGSGDVTVVLSLEGA